ncbi:MAG TPA: hypothetical protein DHV48_04805 [Prolixibacteraceae bacterium]|nr:MAG: hypothetical protein A2066_05280 [Bacteroidetes bacterium GWB2_41_8]HCY40663.1 hypothetical protein [Prolixibacteraceae bacterium]
MKDRPILFQSACIFSIAGSSIGFLSMLLATIFFETVSQKIESFTNITSTDQLSPLYFASLMAAFGVSLAGAIKLYRMQRAGLYFYLTAQIVILFLPVIWMGSNGFSVANTIFTFLFSGVYLYFYRITK